MRAADGRRATAWHSRSCTRPVMPDRRNLGALSGPCRRVRSFRSTHWRRNGQAVRLRGPAGSRRHLDCPVTCRRAILLAPLSPPSGFANSSDCSRQCFHRMQAGQSPMRCDQSHASASRAMRTEYHRSSSANSGSCCPFRCHRAGAHACTRPSSPSKMRRALTS